MIADSMVRLARSHARAKDLIGIDPRLRFPRASLGEFHQSPWTFTMTEAWAWSREEQGLVDRSSSPWDRPSRRLSHADKGLAWRRAPPGEESRAAAHRPGATGTGIRATADGLLSLAA
jgi:hypothetical protein